MTFICLADGCRCLGIDPKTLRRWLAQAQLPVQSHPRDGRLKVLTDEHLRLLARRHHRSLCALPQEEPPAPAACEPPPLPAELLALPEMLTALSAQLAALQQQVTALSDLVQQHAPLPAVPAPQATPAKRVPKLAHPVPRSRPATAAATKPTREPAHVLPLVESGTEGHYVVVCPKQGVLALEPDSPAWFAWLATQSSFRFVGHHGRLTAHREGERVPNGAWRAHRKIRNHTYNSRLGPTESLTIAVLEQAAAALQAHLT